jgi:integral membrane sensor domain MASE1
MGNILIIFLIIAAVKSVVFGGILYFVFRDDIREWWSGKEETSAPTMPVCVYCQSAWTQPAGDPETRWEDDELVLVTTYECQHCRLPFWRVERVPVTSTKPR